MAKTSKQNLDLVHKPQERAIRIVSKLKYDQSPKCLLKNIKIITVYCSHHQEEIKLT